MEFYLVYGKCKSNTFDYRSICTKIDFSSKADINQNMTTCFDSLLFIESVYRPFQDYFTHVKTGQSVGGTKRE